MVGLSLQQHFRQDDAIEGADVDSMRRFIMRRFLQAADEVAAELESSISFSKENFLSKLPSPSLPQQPPRTPLTHQTRSRARQATKGFANVCPRHQKDSSMSRFFCLGCKTLLVDTLHTVDSSFGHSDARANSWVPHPLHHMQVANERTSLSSSGSERLVARKKKAMANMNMAKHQNAINVDVPILHPLLSPDCVHVKERRRRAVKYHAGFSRSSSPGPDGCTNASSSQSSQANLACNGFDNTKSKQSPHDNHGWVRKFAQTALEEQEIETVQKRMTPCNKQACNCKSGHLCGHAENLRPHNVAGENMARNIFQGYLDGLNTLGCTEHEGGNRDEDDKLQFRDSLSRLSSVNSNATFYNSCESCLGSPKSESCDVLGSEAESINNEMEFTEASSHFEIPHAFGMSENKSMPLHVCTANETGTYVKMSSLSQRVGKSLKLETESKQGKSPSKDDAWAFEQKHQCKQAESLTRKFHRRHGSLDSISDLFSLKASTVCSVFPAKCKSKTLSTSGWPLGIFNNHSSSRVEESSCNIQQEKSSTDKLPVRGKIPRPPLPPPPAESWLGHAITKNVSKPSLLAILQQKEKVALCTRKLKCQSMDLDAERMLNFQSERTWEDVVKGSQMHSGRLGYSAELQLLMRTSL